jgi:hypothetical protein
MTPTSFEKRKTSSIKKYTIGYALLPVFSWMIRSSTISTIDFMKDALAISMVLLKVTTASFEAQNHE